MWKNIFTCKNVKKHMNKIHNDQKGQMCEAMQVLAIIGSSIYVVKRKKSIIRKFIYF